MKFFLLVIVATFLLRYYTKNELVNMLLENEDTEEVINTTLFHVNMVTYLTSSGVMYLSIALLLAYSFKELFL